MQPNGFKALRFALAVVTAAAFAACSSNLSTYTNPTTPVGGVGDNGNTLSVRFKNTTALSIWVTDYYGYSSQVGWGIDEAHCVASGQEWQHNIDFHLGLGRPQAKVRAEVKQNVDCSPNSSISDVTTPGCTINFEEEHVKQARVIVRHINRNDYEITDLEGSRLCR